MTRLRAPLACLALLLAAACTQADPSRPSDDVAVPIIGGASNLETTPVTVETRTYVNGKLDKTKRVRTTIGEMRAGRLQSIVASPTPADSSNLYHMFGEVLEFGAPTATRTMSDGQPATVALGHIPDPTALDEIVIWKGTYGYRASAQVSRSASATYLQSMRMAKTTNGVLTLETIASFDGAGFPLSPDTGNTLAAKQDACWQHIVRALLQLVNFGLQAERNPSAAITAWLDAMISFQEWLNCILT